MKYSLGLDIGIASVGWAVLDLENERIHDLGVRLFEKAENPKDGASLNTPRRNARSMRRRLHRRRQRLNYLKHYFVTRKWLTEQEIFEILRTPNDPYEVRSRALDDAITYRELFIALYHIAKRRGYKSNRRNEVETSGGASSETGKVKIALEANRTLLEKYRTIGEALHKDSQFSVHKRNRGGTYANSFQRADFSNEVRAILEAQQRKGLDITQKDIQLLSDEVRDDSRLIFAQRPFMTDELMMQMIGACTFEKNEKRAPRSTHAFEAFRMINELNNIVFERKGIDAPKDTPAILRLSPEQVMQVFTFAKTKNKVAYEDIRKVLNIQPWYRFKEVRGKIESEATREKNTFGELPAYHELRKALKGHDSDWHRLSTSPVTMDEVAVILATQKEDAPALEKMSTLSVELSMGAQKALLSLLSKKPFTAFGHLSLKALRAILPHIENGLTYDKACQAAGYDFRETEYDIESITNPVVRRAISQTNKVIKAIVRTYGAPYYIHIESTGELAKNYKDRMQIKKSQDENRAKNEKIIRAITDEYGILHPKGAQIVKMKLYREQRGVCLYSGETINPHQMLSDDTMYQIDHILPFSRSALDSYTNKVLVKTAENQDKGNKTPYEYFGADVERWGQFVSRVNDIYGIVDIKTLEGKEKADQYRRNGYAMKKRSHLLAEQYSRDGWGERALNDTRYIAKFMRNFVKQTVDFAPGEDKQRVFVPNGQLTSRLRNLWGIPKSREENCLHHAQDAAIVAAVNQKTIMQANMYAKSRECKKDLQLARTIDEKVKILTDLTDVCTGEVKDDVAFASEQAQLQMLQATQLAKQLAMRDAHIEPWSDFAKEVRKRTMDISTNELHNELRGIKQYDEEFRQNIRPIFVSRMPQRKHRGSAHKETLRAPKKQGDMSSIRVPLTSLKHSQLGSLAMKDTDQALYEEICQRMKSQSEKDAKAGEKAFVEPLYKKNRLGDNTTRIRTVKVLTKEPTGFYINDGRTFVNNGDMVCVDIYMKPNKKDAIEHFFVPVYVHQAYKNAPRPTAIMPQPKEYTDIDETFTNVCRLYPNDYVRIYMKNKVHEGYYRGYDVSGGTLSLMAHATSDGRIVRVSARKAVSIERLDISILGNDMRRL